MSKAFVKDEGASEEVSVVRRELTSPSENYLTSEGHAQFRKEWDALQKERAELEPQSSPAKDARWPELERRIGFLKQLLDTAHIIDPEQQSGDRVLFGATVTVLDDDEQERIYKLVGVEETDIKQGKISWISPIGKALLQARVGDIVVLKTPSKEEELEIVKIEFI